jgi:hypothetical protein
MFLGFNPTGEPICLESSDLLTHGVILGRTGSGKTGLTVAMIEEATTEGANVVAFDPKGDLTNLALALTSQEEFAEWVEPGDTPEGAHKRHMKGLAVYGLGEQHVEWWRNKVNVKVYAPGKTYGGGTSVNIFPTFEPPRQKATRDQAARSVATVLQALQEGDDPYDPALIYLTEAVLVAWEANYALPLDYWAGLLTQPPEYLSEFGGMGIDDFFPKRRRTRLARTVIGFQHQADRWLAGESFDLHKFVSQDRPQVAVFSMRHLSVEDRLFFTSIMMQRLVEFMFETESSQKLKLLAVLDEARGYLPPHPKNPPTKNPICTILAQGRAQGLGMLIGTQNPMDLDYKALSNVGTWAIGRLRERDCARDLASELRDRNIAIEDLADLPQRRFLLLDKAGKHNILNVRWCYNFLRGPLSGQELLGLEGGTPEDESHPGFLKRLFGRSKKQ